MDSKDCPSKLAKLATEYSKLRSQIAVLKKAFTDEQAHCIELKEHMRVKDQKLRIAESEIDSLTFRNQQLTRRVSILVQELEELKNKNKKFVHKSQIEQQESHQTVDEEFSKKIAENAKLLYTLNECKEKHENDVKELNSIINKLKHELTITSAAPKEFKGTDVKIQDDVDDEDLDVTDDSISRADTGTSEVENAIFSETLLNGIKCCRIEKQKLEDNEEETVGDAIQKALQDQLLNVEQYNNKLKHENLQLSSEKKKIEAKLKELMIKYEIGQSQLIGSTNYIPTEETYARETGIKVLYEGEIKTLQADLKYAKSCIDTYYKEIQSLKFRLDVEVSDKITLQSECSSIELERAKLEEELKTTKANYEAQITTMSEHIASLNDTIQLQKDEIDALTYHLETKKRDKKK